MNGAMNIPTEIRQDETGHPEVFRYTNFRDYLKDYYEFRKSENPRFSYRVFARQAGFQSPTYMMMIISGIRNLTPPNSKKVAKVCGLKEDHLKYFNKLVLFNQAQNSERKLEIWDKIAKLQARQNIYELSDRQLKVFSNLPAMVVLQMTSLDGFEWDADWIATRLEVPVKIQTISAIMNSLEYAELVKIVDGKVVPCKKIIFAGGDIPSEVIQLFHASVLKEAGRAISGIEPKKPGVSCHHSHHGSRKDSGV